ncbi:MOZ protein represents a chromatin-associated acetyltransferase [Verticillium dahliae]
MANHPWMPPLDTYHDEDFPYHQGRELMITPHEAPEPFDGPSYYRPSDPSSTFDGDGDAVIKQHKTRSQLVAECLPRGAAWPTDDGTKSSQHIGLTIEKTIKTTKERGSQVVVCKLNLGQMHKGIPARVVAKIYDPLYYPFLACALPYASDVVRQADMDLSREAAVYQHFKTMGTDGQFAPKYYGAFTMPMRSHIAGKYRPVCLILLEHIDGSTMRASCTVPYNRIPALVPGPHAGNDDQRMLVMKELVDIESKMRHTGVVYGTMMPENVMISRPSPTKANAALKPHSCSRVADARGQHETAVLKTAGRDLAIPFRTPAHNTTMSTARLTFLYPPLFRPLRVSTGVVQATRTSRKRYADPRRQRAVFSTAFAPRAPVARRHGKAVEPLPAPAEDDEMRPPLAPPSPEALAKDSELAAAAAAAAATTPTTEPAAEAQPPPPTAQGPADTSAESDAQGKDAAASDSREEARQDAKKSGPLEAMLQMPEPGTDEGGARQHPHLSPPPYVHHFDSYSLVRQLQAGGYTEVQATSVMKAVRRILAQNLDVAQDSLVSKSDVENETYLFRAACSELSTEVKNNQRIADEEMRQQRTLLQHEVDILTQSLSQEVLTLNDNVRGMFNDRKIAVSEEQKGVDSIIQQINYKISISLSSDAKSEIEGLRWVLIRRSVLGILFMAVLTLGTLRYGTYVSHENKREAERLQRQAEVLRASDGKRDHSSAPDAAEILAAS